MKDTHESSLRHTSFLFSSRKTEKRKTLAASLLKAIEDGRHQISTETFGANALAKF